MKNLFYSLLLMLVSTSCFAQFGTITFNQDTVVIMRRLKILTLRPGLVGDTIMVHKANGNIGGLHMNQLIIPYANLSGAPDLNDYYPITNPSGYISGISSGMINTALGYTPYNGTTNPNSFLTSVPAQTFASLTGKPTTLSGYGITDATTNARSAVSAGTSIGYDSSTGVITNSSPDQTVVLSGSNGITTSGTYPSFTVAKTKRQETYTGSTNGSGVYTITYGTAYSAAPNVQFQINGGTNKTTILLTSSTTTACSFLVQLRADVLGILPSYSNVSGAVVDALVTEK